MRAPEIDPLPYSNSFLFFFKSPTFTGKLWNFVSKWRALHVVCHRYSNPQNNLTNLVAWKRTGTSLFK
jgi:hypothetical protein